MVKAHVTPSRKEGSYTRIALYSAGSERPFLVLDEMKVKDREAAAILKSILVDDPLKSDVTIKK